MYEVVRYGDELYHHGILGMKWGVRRYQNKDGSLTPAGRKHYGRNYTVRDLKKNIQDPNLSYTDKKAMVSANKVNRISKTKYRDAATSVATGAAGLSGAAALTGLMAAGVLSVNPLLPVASIAGGIVAGKTGNALRHFINNFRDIKVEMIDRQLDKEELTKPKKEEPKTNNEPLTIEKMKKNPDKVMTIDFYEQLVDEKPNMTHEQRERETFNFVENKIKGLNEKERRAQIAILSGDMDGYVNDDPGLLVYDVKNNKIVSRDDSYQMGNHKDSSGNKISPFDSNGNLSQEQCDRIFNPNGKNRYTYYNWGNESKLDTNLMNRAKAMEGQYTAKEVAEMLGVSESTVYDYWN